MKLSIIMVSYNTREILREAIEKVYRQERSFPDFELIVVDNASADGSADMVAAEFPRVRLIRHDQNAGFAAGNNLGIAKATGEYILLLNSDAYVFEDSLSESVTYMDEHAATGIMGAQLICEDGSPQPSARPFPTPWQKFRVLTGIEARHPSFVTYYDYFASDDHGGPEPRSVDWVPGTYFLIRRELIQQIGGLDERFFMYFEEVDYCKRTRAAGWDVVFNPRVSIIHLGGQSSLSTKRELSRTGRQLVDIRVNSEYDYYRKHGGRLTVLQAALAEVGWKSLIWIKNVFSRSPEAQIKRSESELAIHLVWHKLRHVLI